MMAAGGIIAWIAMGYAGYKRGGWNGVATEMFGYAPGRGKFVPKEARGAIMLLIGVGGSYVAAKSGVNRYTPKGWNL
jgi:hypothetical protein